MIECIKFKSFEKGHLQGFADFYLPQWGIEIQGCALYMKEGQRWVNLPGKEYEKDGQKKYAPHIRFRDKDHWEAFMKQAKEAIDTFCKKNSASQNKSYEIQDKGDLPF